jgi:hypothetical protein
MLTAGYTTFNLGMHGGRDPRLIREDQVSKAINMSIKGGSWKTRPGANHLELDFGSRTNDAKIFKTGKFQGMSLYSQSGFSELHLCIEGNYFRISLDNMRTRIRNPASGAGSSTVDRVIFQQHGRYMLKQDGVTAPVIVDSGVVRNPVDQELPLGYFMASGNGYLVVSSADRSKFWVSDHYGGTTATIYEGSGNPITGEDYGPLTFNDATAYYFFKGAFEATNQSVGPITSMHFMSELDRAEGHGPLIVGHQSGLFAYDLGIPRQDWVVKAIGKQILQNIGSTAHDQVVHLNGDLGFKSVDGLRTLHYSRSTHSERLSQRSMSHELDCWLDHEIDWLLYAGSGCVFDKQWFSTGMPEQFVTSVEDEARADIVHRGLFVHEFDVLSGTTEESPSVYSGLWTYPNRKVLFVTSGIVDGAERMFVMTMNSDGENELWEQTSQATHDDGNIRIRSRLDLGVRFFDDIGQAKAIEAGYVYFGDVQQSLELEMRYSFDSDPEWQDWARIAKRVPIDVCEDLLSENCFTEGMALMPQTYPRHPIPKPNRCEPLPGRRELRSTGRELRVQIESLGHYRLDAFEMEASPLGRANVIDFKESCEDLTLLEPDPLLSKCQDDYRYTNENPIIETDYEQRYKITDRRCGGGSERGLPGTIVQPIDEAVQKEQSCPSCG